jgi:hypothetical protein
MPLIKITRNTLGTIVVIRNPFNGAWLMNLTIAAPQKHVHIVIPPKKESLELEYRPGYTLAKLAYMLSLVSLVLVFFVGCNPSEQVERAPTVQAFHAKACLELPPIVQDSTIRYLETYTLKVGSYSRSRCSFCPDHGAVECKSKTDSPINPKLPDTLYTIDTYCPKTLETMNQAPVTVEGN